MAKSKCDCGKIFDFQPATQTVRDVEIRYAECEGCGKRYLISVIDQEIEDRLEKTRELLKRFHDMSLPLGERQRAWQEKQAFDKETRKMMKRKKDQYGQIVNKVIGL